jgi:hypothetical protein
MPISKPICASIPFCRLSPVVESVLAVPSINNLVPVKRLRGVLQRGSGFMVMISVPNSADQAIVHHLPQVYSTGMEAALAYDCITLASPGCYCLTELGRPH